MNPDSSDDVRECRRELYGFSTRLNVITDADKLNDTGVTCPEQNLRQIGGKPNIREMHMSINEFQQPCDTYLPHRAPGTWWACDAPEPMNRTPDGC